MKTSWNVYDYPDAPSEWNDVKEVSGKVWICYKFKTEVPKKWDKADILNDIYENTSDYEQDLDDIDLDI